MFVGMLKKHAIATSTEKIRKTGHEVKKARDCYKHRKLPRHCTICFALVTASSVSESCLPFKVFMDFMLFMVFGGFGSSGLAPGLAPPPG